MFKKRGSDAEYIKLDDYGKDSTESTGKKINTIMKGIADTKRHGFVAHVSYPESGYGFTC